MPDGIVEIAIDIGAIREAQKRVAVKRMINDSESMRKLRDGLASAASNIADMMRRMWQQEDETDET